MSCCEANVACFDNHTNNLAYEYCHPPLRENFRNFTPAETNDEYCHPPLRENFRNFTPAETNDENCMRNGLACGDCCYPQGQECFDTDPFLGNSRNFRETGQEKHLHCLAHSCPLGKVICCTDCKKSDCKNDKDIIKAEDISETQERIICHPVRHEDPMYKDIAVMKDRPCCAKEKSWTEPRICRCDPCDPNGYMKRCGCECGAAIFTEPPKDKPKKTVRFADEVVKPEDCEKAFRNLDIEDVKHLCTCCRECASIGKEQCVGNPVLVYEFPEQKLDDTSVTRKDFCWQKMPSREVPPWHPNIKDRWRHLDVPSLCETTHQCDFKSPPVAYAERKPVYLAPQREKIDPCQQLADEYCSWRKTSTGEKHTYHSSCDECDKDLQRVHLHECNVAHLPPQYQCHGDGHLCQPSFHTTGEKFTLCEKGNAGESRYWWKRTCCVPEEKDREKVTDLPPDLMKPVCPAYITSYKHDFKDPYRLQDEKLYFGKCTVCDACSRPQGEEQPNLLCTKNTREPFIVQRAGIV